VGKANEPWTKIMDRLTLVLGAAGEAVAVRDLVAETMTSFFKSPFALSVHFL
jgi:hypothetical protein